MRQILVLFLLLLAACAQRPQPAPTPAAESGAAEFSSWRLPSGKAPTRLEFAALLAACKEGGKAPAQPIDRCLLTLGLKRAP